MPRTNRRMKPGVTSISGSNRGPANSAAILGAALKSGVARDGHSLPRFWKQQYRKLLALRDRFLAERNGHVLAVHQPLEPFSLDMADTATDAVDHDLALGELSSEQDVLYEIEEALKRIANGSYGICEVTHKPIPRARLEAVPWTRFSQQAERELETSGATARPHLGELRSVVGATQELAETTASDEEGPQSMPADEALYHSTQVPPLVWPQEGKRRTRAAEPAQTQRSRGRPGARAAPRRSKKARNY